MKPILLAMTCALFTTFIGLPAQAAETACKGDAKREKPPIPNHSTHIRNVVWRNTRMMCLQELANKRNNPTTSNQSSQETPTSNSPNKLESDNNRQPQPSP